MNNSQTSINLQEVTNLRNRLYQLSRDIQNKIEVACGCFNKLSNARFIEGQVLQQLSESQRKLSLAAKTLIQSINVLNEAINEAQTQFEDLDVQFAGTIEKLGNVDPTKYSAGGINE